MYTILVLTEEQLTPHDVARVAALHGDEQVAVHVVVPVDTSHNRLVEALDDALLGRLREAAREEGDEEPEDARLAAGHALDQSVHALREAGVEAEGSLVGDDPVPDVLALLPRVGADEILVVTAPHLLEEAFNRDWGSRLQESAGLPVLHVVAGTDRVVS